MSKFKVGDCIRSVRPYWGEPAYTLTVEVPEGFYLESTRNKHGKGGITQFLSHWELEGFHCDGGVQPYALCPKYIRVWLAILGTLVAMKNWVRERV